MGTIIANQNAVPAGPAVETAAAHPPAAGAPDSAAATNRPRAAAAATAILAAAVTAFATPAAATGTRVGVDPGISVGSATKYGTSCTYTIDGYVDDPVTPVGFYDNGILFAVAKPSGALAQAKWTPVTQGPHRLEILQQSVPGDDVIPYVDVTVGMGVNAGSGCNVF
ncbi:hypothetical protein JK358_29495 [Nocardia sp. 2]|uniref:Uncharacterized protein n=1 Tax=Nocardia acididurans TaxID=2802282 RepID=A0ABS1MH53_9NOCA|nr:hypothetical protein [Nocardia acididurans]MBL1078548.1 hypothetical protein [Nocardia acididurans]